jgi:amidase
MSNFALTSALELAQQIRRKEISPLELTHFFLNRIENFNPQLGSFSYLAAEAAIADARQKTEQLAKIRDPQQLPPFFGVPTSIKDLNTVAGMPTSYGVAGLQGNISAYDDGVVTRIKQAGFIILGKTFNTMG